MQDTEHTIAQHESRRLSIAGLRDRADKKHIGQFLTPWHTARFMASLFTTTDHSILLDPGAGSGMLTAAFLERTTQNSSAGSLVAVETDPLVLPMLTDTIAQANKGQAWTTRIVPENFITFAKDHLQQDETPFTLVIMNPPYRKINVDSWERKALSQLGIETVNLYSAFVMLAIDLLAPDGELVAIIPRSFCNGPYYRSMREYITKRTSIQQIHYIESRTAAFADDNVLQENVIIHLKKCPQEPTVKISYSRDALHRDVAESLYPIDDVIYQMGRDVVIRIPQLVSSDTLPLGSASLHDVGVSVSTGPVVDFRLREFLRDQPDTDTCPLLYPVHVANTRVRWPIEGSKKPNAFVVTAESFRWTYPMGTYVVVRRFSSKEERKRIVATVVEPSDVPGMDRLAFENHVNVFHVKRSPLDPDIARGLAAYLNTTAVDLYFREISGHTQVNATDLRNLPYPDKETLQEIGRSTQQATNPTQPELDRLVGTILRRAR